MGKQRPGVMIYFDVAHSLSRLSNEDVGILFKAIMAYGEFGSIPEFDGMLAMAWDFIRPRLDRDAQKYEEICKKRTAAINSRWNKERVADKDSSDTKEYSSIETIPTEREPEQQRYLHPERELKIDTHPTTATGGMGGSFFQLDEPELDDLERENLRRRRILELQGWNPKNVV